MSSSSPETETAQLTHRIITCLPAASFELETLARLLGIEASREIGTACVECAANPRLLINPYFAAQYCKRDEHLFLLVMHELWHILLAHTRLYPRVTPAENIAFDAIINAGLCCQFSGPEYRGFFEALNAPDQFPALLLRPPIGWPANPVLPEQLPEKAKNIMRRLYPKDNQTLHAAPLYAEILELLGANPHWAIRVRLLPHAGFTDDVPFLIGEHEAVDRDEMAMDHALVGSVVRRIVGAWPPPPIPLRRRSSGGGCTSWQQVLGPAAQDARRVFGKVLTRCLGPVPGVYHRRKRTLTLGVGGAGALPNAQDRTAPARRALGSPALLWNQPGLVRARIPNAAQAHLYLDVSGSMAAILPRLLSLILPYIADGRANAFQFSTCVEYLPLSKLRAGNLQSTRGTDINCVLDHLLKTGVRRALVLTDGCTGTPRDDFARRVKDQCLRLYAVLPAESAWLDDLKTLASKIVTLPPL